MSWTDNFFTGLFAESVRSIYPDALTQTQADFLLALLNPAPGDKLLDVPCGGGRLSLAIARRGFTVIGVDSSRELIDHAWHDAEVQRLPAAFQHRDMRQPGVEKFPHAFCMGNSFAYFDDAGNRAFLKAIYDSLTPGGGFVLETNLAAESVLTLTLGKRWYPFGDLLFLHDSVYDPLTATLTSTYRLIQGTTSEEKQAVYRIYTCRQILELFREVGFIVEATYGSLQKTPFQLGLPGLYVHARRPTA